ncbi:hypothetical protein WS72_27810 [Burkholderia savannae]|uniref:Uncharacterized protein n=1 Tax=Burkholderia savannae TaxID=1637837 RepID=A0ABR5T614_9BURK|nr:hypothetical protein WS72_27810 [Burkholderia savannae]
MRTSSAVASLSPRPPARRCGSAFAGASSGRELVVRRDGRMRERRAAPSPNAARDAATLRPATQPAPPPGGRGASSIDPGPRAAGDARRQHVVARASMLQQSMQ